MAGLSSFMRRARYESAIRSSQKTPMRPCDREGSDYLARYRCPRCGAACWQMVRGLQFFECRSASGDFGQKFHDQPHMEVECLTGEMVLLEEHGL